MYPPDLQKSLINVVLLFWVILVEHKRVSIVSISLSDFLKNTLPCVVPYAGFNSAGDAGSEVYVSVSFNLLGSSHCQKQAQYKPRCNYAGFTSTASLSYIQD